MKLITTLALLLAACAETPPPSCSQAIGHYYGVGCTFINSNTSQPTSQPDALNACVQVALAVPSQCVEKMNVWLECVDVATISTCDCTQQSMALLTCR